MRDRIFPVTTGLEIVQGEIEYIAWCKKLPAWGLNHTERALTSPALAIIGEAGPK